MYKLMNRRTGQTTDYRGDAGRWLIRNAAAIDNIVLTNTVPEAPFRALVIARRGSLTFIGQFDSLERAQRLLARPIFAHAERSYASNHKASYPVYACTQVRTEGGTDAYAWRITLDGKTTDEGQAHSRFRAGMDACQAAIQRWQADTPFTQHVGQQADADVRNNGANVFPL